MHLMKTTTVVSLGRRGNGVSLEGDIVDSGRKVFTGCLRNASLAELANKISV